MTSSSHMSATIAPTISRPLVRSERSVVMQTASHGPLKPRYGRARSPSPVSGYRTRKAPRMNGCTRQKYV